MGNVDIKEPAWALTYIGRDKTKWNVCNVSLTVVWYPGELVEKPNGIRIKQDSHFDIGKERSSDFIW